jgi:type VI secretion system secreted protein Hcp
VRSPRPSTLSRTLALVPPAVILVSQHANATFNSFLKFSTIAGESTDAKHANWIDITKFSFGSGQSTPVIPGGPTYPVATEFTISKKLDKASPQLFLACAMGTVVPTVTLELVTTGQTAVFYRIILTNATVKSTVTAGTTALDLKPDESISVSYEKIHIDYYIQDGKGGTTLASTIDWDFTTPPP